MTIEERALSVTAPDGRDLAALALLPPKPRAGVFITAGTGFRKEYYRRFAQQGAERGFACLMLDCRGIGSSALADPASDPATYLDWARLDMPAGVDALEALVPGLALFHIGHSVGGHFAGFWPNHAKIAAHAFVCVGSGYWGDHPIWYRPVALWFWHGWGRYSLARYGYIARGGGWTGAPLPRRLFEVWRRWCHQRDYFVVELADRLRPHYFDAITAPIRSYIYRDDPIASPKTGQAMLDCYANAPREMVVRAPAEHGLKAIGHSGPFSKQSLKAADEIWDWIADRANR